MTFCPLSRRSLPKIIAILCFFILCIAGSIFWLNNKPATESDASVTSEEKAIVDSETSEQTAKDEKDGKDSTESNTQLDQRTAERHAQAAAVLEEYGSLIPNGDFELGRIGGWPESLSLITEDDNTFARLQSTTPDEIFTLRRKIDLPSGLKALKLSWRWRVSDLQVGKQSWFDARYLLEFYDAEDKKIEVALPAPNTRKNTEGWEARDVDFYVPEEAISIAIMPTLFRVKSGTIDLDDIVLAPTDTAALEEKERQRVKRIAERQAKAAAVLAEHGTLISNGDFEAGHAGGWPKSVQLITEDGNTFARLQSEEPDKLYMIYRQIDLPPNLKALKLTWSWRVPNLRMGEAPWFDARWLLEFRDAFNKKIGGPSAPYTRGVGDWDDREKDFLVPDGAVSVVLMPSLFRVESGVMDLDNIRLVPTDTKALEAAAAKRAEEERQRYVAPEEDQREQWPSPIRVEGNRLVDSKGQEVWLQGVNTSNLETLPNDMQVLKSVVMGIDEWKSNVIRLPVKEEFWYGHSFYQKDGGKAYREKVDQIITLTANRGAYLVLDLHRFRAPKKEHLEFWQDAAARYANHPAVLFDIFNEPHNISWETWRNGGFVDEKSEAGIDESS